MSQAKNLIQQDLLSNVLYHKNILISWATGVGKGRVGVLAHDLIKPISVLINVAEITHITNWKEEYKKLNKEHLLENTIISCYHSLHKHANQEFDLIINDECHHISENRAEILSTIKVKKVLNLSATTKFDERILLESLWGKLYVHLFTMKNAIEHKALVKPTINLIELQLDNVFPTENIVIFANKKKITKKLTPFQKYQYLTSIVEKKKQLFLQANTQFNQITWLRSGLQRKQYLSFLKTKTLKNLVVSLQNKRFICFCGSIEQSKALGENVLHSKQPVKLQTEIFNKFISKEINSIAVVNKLKEGNNIPDLDLIIIGQPDGQERNLIQKIGRVLRNEIDPAVYILYFKDTQDEVYVNQFLKHVDSSYIKKITL